LFIKLRCIFVFLCLLHSNSALAIDIIKINSGQSKSDIRSLYKMEIINQALTLTEPDFGAFEIRRQGPPTTIDRAILEVVSGESINTFIALTTQQWEDNTLAIRIPIRRGILNYRLLVINKDSQSNFTNISSVNDLKKLKAGVRIGWATTKVLAQNEFNLHISSSYEGLFYMLQSNRIDYIPRGINEIYDEITLHKDQLNNLDIEPNIALYIPAPTYIFVSPTEPIIAKRLTEGLELMVRNGMLKKLFNKYYKDKLKKANLSQRTIFPVKYSILPKLTPLDRKELWFEFDVNE